MIRLACFAMALSFSACKLQAPPAAEPGLAGRAALDLTGAATTSGWGDKSAFARSVAARYAGGVPASNIIADATAQGFTCDAEAAECLRTEMSGACVTTWIIDIADRGATGRHFMRCMGAEPGGE